MKTPQTLLILDTETTGTDDSAVCIEVACALYSVPRVCVLRSYASLIRADANPAEALNHIPASALVDAPEPATVWAGVAKFAQAADTIVAHNADFDRRFVPEWAQCNRNWICTMDDVAWPLASKPGEGLVSLALAHGLGVATAHRASADVELLCRLFARVSDFHGVDHVNAMLVRAMRPKARFVVAARDFDAARNELAKRNGFRWDQPEAPRQWSRSMAIEDAGALPFETRMVGS